MPETQHIEIIDRRDVIVGAGSVAALFALMRASATAQQPRPDLTAYDEVLRKIIGEAKPLESKLLTIELPDIAENGNTVPFTLSIESPMTEKDYVRKVHILATGNPQVAVGSFSFTPQSGRAAVSSRMRLARTQDVVAVAELSNDTFLIAKRSVKVTIGGCGG